MFHCAVLLSTAVVRKLMLPVLFLSPVHSGQNWNSSHEVGQKVSLLLCLQVRGKTIVTLSLLHTETQRVLLFRDVCTWCAYIRCCGENVVIISLRMLVCVTCRVSKVPFYGSMWWHTAAARRAFYRQEINLDVLISLGICRTATHPKMVTQSHQVLI